MAKYEVRFAGSKNETIDADDVSFEDSGALNFWKWVDKENEESVTVYAIALGNVIWVKRVGE